MGLGTEQLKETQVDGGRGRKVIKMFSLAIHRAAVFVQPGTADTDGSSSPWLVNNGDSC